MKEKEIRASYDHDSIVVYQAYRKEIALPAVENQQFVAPFKLERMTWIKPSFLWMMYRSGWGGKEGQEHILKIRISKAGFEWAMENSCLSHYDEKLYASYEAWKQLMAKTPVRIQWDPEKDIHLLNLPYRSIQIGLSGIAVPKYVNEWILSIEDITDHCKVIHEMIAKGDLETAKALMPKEDIYPVSEHLREIIGHS